MRNLANALIRHDRIQTTDAKAKELRRFADRLVTLGKEASEHARRRAFDRIQDQASVTKLFDELAPRFQSREGGYTRITKIGVRHGDAAPVSMIEWTTEPDQTAKKAKGRRKAAAEKQATKSEPRKRAAAG